MILQFGVHKEVTVGAWHGPKSTLPLRLAGRLPGMLEAEVHFAPYRIDPEPDVVLKKVVGSVGHFFPEFDATLMEFVSAK